MRLSAMSKVDLQKYLLGNCIAGDPSPVPRGIAEALATAFKDAIPHTRSAFRQAAPSVVSIPQRTPRDLARCSPHQSSRGRP